MFRFIAVSVTAISLMACSNSPSQVKASGSPKPGATAAPAALTSVVLTGNVMAAAGIVAQGAGNIVASGAGNIVAQGAGNFGLLRRQLFEISENPLANATVFLANPDGTPLAGASSGTTDASGAFKLPNVPIGSTVVVATRVKTKDGKDALMETLAVPAKDSTTAGMGTATTLVARAVLGTSAAKPGLVDVTNWVETVEICKGQLQPGQWPDLSNQQAIDDWMTGLEQKLPDMDAHVKKLQANLKGS